MGDHPGRFPVSVQQSRMGHIAPNRYWLTYSEPSILSLYSVSPQRLVRTSQSCPESRLSVIFLPGMAQAWSGWITSPKTEDILTVKTLVKS